MTDLAPVTQQLADREAVIEKGLQTFLDVGRELVAIRDERLYLERNATFEEYLADRWNMSRQRGYDMMNAAETAAALDVRHGVQVTERQLRPLASLPPEQKREAWRKALDSTTRTDREGNPNPTGAEVAAAAAELKRFHLAEGHARLERKIGEMEAFAAELKRPQPGDQIIDDEGTTHDIVEVIGLDDEHACIAVDAEGDCLVIPDTEDDAVIEDDRPRLTQSNDHPATYPSGMVDLFATIIDTHYRQAWWDEHGPGIAATRRQVLDPFAGVGGIHALAGRTSTPIDTTGIELEPEWAEKHPLTLTGSALDLPFGTGSIDVIATSPTYGNRMADHHNARDDSHRNTYRHTLGRELTDGSSAGLQWGDIYRAFHQQAWTEAVRVLTCGGLFILNIKDHVRNGTRQPVSAWHAKTLLGLGLEFVDCVPFRSGGLPVGANADARIDAELVWVFTRPEATNGD